LSILIWLLKPMGMISACFCVI